VSNPTLSKRARRRACGALGAAALLVAAPAAGASAVNLGTSGAFAVLGGSTVTNTGGSTLSGDLGVSPGTALAGFTLPAVLNGAAHANDAVAAQAQADAATAYGVAAGQPVAALNVLTGTDLGSRTLLAGAYTYATSAQLTGALTLDAGGDPNAQFVFEIGSTLTTASASSVVLVNGASACNVYWQIGSSATLGTSTAFQGNLLASTAITLDNGASLVGRAMAQTAAVTLDTNVITAPNCATPSGGGSTTGGTTTTGATATGTTTLQTASASLGSRAAGSSAATGSAARAGTAVFHRQLGRKCDGAFHASVRGAHIKQVLFRLDGKRVTTVGHAPFAMTTAGRAGHHNVTASVSFTDATPATRLALGYSVCAGALRPVTGPSAFTG
jgi:hypothetical protein